MYPLRLLRAFAIVAGLRCPISSVAPPPQGEPQRYDRAPVGDDGRDHDDRRPRRVLAHQHAAYEERDQKGDPPQQHPPAHGDVFSSMQLTPITMLQTTPQTHAPTRAATTRNVQTVAQWMADTTMHTSELVWSRVVLSRVSHAPRQRAEHARETGLAADLAERRGAL